MDLISKNYIILYKNTDVFSYKQKLNYIIQKY